jgi:hypothetical protein
VIAGLPLATWVVLALAVVPGVSMAVGFYFANREL